MKSNVRWKVVGLCIASLPLTACAKPPVEEEVQSRTVKVEPIEGTDDLNRLIVTEDGAKRLDLQTAPVRSVFVRGTGRKVIPYAALLYDKDGDSWAYTTTSPLTFVRTPITVDYIEDSLAVLSVGPPVGTMVVTVGATELYGSEEEFEEE